MVNSRFELEQAFDAASATVGADNIVTNAAPTMGAEDFAYMLQAVPGSYLLLGSGAGPNLHNAQYDFNDALLPVGASYWVNLVHAVLKPAA